MELLLLHTDPTLTVSPSHPLGAMAKDGTLGDRDLGFDPYGQRSLFSLCRNYFLIMVTIELTKTQVTQQGSDVASFRI